MRGCTWLLGLGLLSCPAPQARLSPAPPAQSFSAGGTAPASLPERAPTPRSSSALQLEEDAAGRWRRLSLQLPLLQGEERAFSLVLQALREPELAHVIPLSLAVVSSAPLAASCRTLELSADASQLALAQPIEHRARWLPEGTHLEIFSTFLSLEALEQASASALVRLFLCGTELRLTQEHLDALHEFAVEYRRPLSLAR